MLDHGNQWDYGIDLGCSEEFIDTLGMTQDTQFLWNSLPFGP